MKKMVRQFRIFLKQQFDRIHNDRLRRNLLNALPFWVGAFIAGSASVLYAKLFAFAEQGTHYIFDKAKWPFFIITPVCFVLAWWVVKKFAPYARGSGIPQVTAAIELNVPKEIHKVNALLNLRIIWVKLISSLVMVFGGGIIGREGPTIQISASIFRKINDILPAWYPKISRKNMIVTGAAAGLGAAFNTPLGGIVFAIEELTRTHFSFFKSALLTGVIISGLTALNFLGPYLYLGYPKLDNISGWIIVTIIPLAVLTGVAGNGTGLVILWLMKWKSNFKKQSHHLLYVLLCGLAIATVAVFIDVKIFGSGKSLMVTSLFTDDKYMAWYVPLLRMGGSMLSFSTGAAGGIFAPSLSAGASIGSVVASIFELPPTATNLMILCGMTGFLTSITRSPFTSSIIVLEMTDSHSVIFYIMLTALLANLVASAISRHSFYDRLKLDYLHEMKTFGEEKEEEPQKEEIESDDEEIKKES